MSVRIWAASAAVTGLSGACGAGVLASTTRLGVTVLPAPIEAATVAMPSGDARTLAWPIIDAACSVPGFGSGTDPRKAGTPRAACAVSPRAAAAAGRSVGASFSPAEMNAVLHEWAKAELNGTDPSADAGKPVTFLKERPSTVTVGEHSTVELGVRPERSRASVDTVLNVEPGAERLWVAVDVPLPPGPLAAARTCPVDGWMATIAEAGSTGARTDSAASCVATSRVSVTGVPGVGSVVKRVRSVGPPLATTA
jgi:hypothetical protein